MTEEEKIIFTEAGKRNAFRVPEGYFEQFAEQMMQQLPERKPAEPSAGRKPAKVVRLRHYIAAAACLCLAIFSVTLYLHQHQQGNEPQMLSATGSQQSINNADETYFDEAADYVMLDNAEIYAYLSEY
ncbi:MAG: hypothetical protein IJ527_03035 [Prevotella sp.]|nr:hypothetical protein [Prevotella sp.]